MEHKYDLEWEKNKNKKINKNKRIMKQDFGWKNSRTKNKQIYKNNETGLYSRTKLKNKKNKNKKISSVLQIDVFLILLVIFLL